MFTSFLKKNDRGEEKEERLGKSGLSCEWEYVATQGFDFFFEWWKMMRLETQKDGRKHAWDNLESKLLNIYILRS